MRTYAQELITDLNEQLEEIHFDTSDPIVYSGRAINSVGSILEKLKNFLMSYSFANKSDEIQFFREIKPQFASKLIYYNEIYKMETQKPLGSNKVQRKYYNVELNKLHDFFDQNSHFYTYVRTGNRYLDKKYFVRGKHDFKLCIDSFHLQADLGFSTSHDYKLAKILANNTLKTYIEGKLKELHYSSTNVNLENTLLHSQKWTASKVALTELIYALHAEGVFNNGASELKEITAFFETTFHVDLGQFHRTFLDIRSRTSERTKFLNGLRDKLIVRMDQSDH